MRSVLSIVVDLSVLSTFLFNDTATTEIYTLSLHDALPICLKGQNHRVSQNNWMLTLVTLRKRFLAFWVSKPLGDNTLHSLSMVSWFIPVFFMTYLIKATIYIHKNMFPLGCTKWQTVEEILVTRLIYLDQGCCMCDFTTLSILVLPYAGRN